ncbi:ubiquitin family protein [Rhodotorula toruloides]|uniref:Ubiquitin family protein n=1 Tax=Rhodotorula toruloides TaxID=5286 RepID=A0A511KA59_RHOTO|nr:ubiquitin family protein [Rhodotorula toruloides]
MEQLLNDHDLSAEIQNLRATVDLLASQKLRYPNNYVPPVEERHRRATLVNVPVCEPPTTIRSDDDDATPAAEPLNLTIKSLKPPLTFTLAARPTATICDLKAELSAKESDAPAPQAQRWILKGKAMGDTKLLKEFAVQDGTVVNLMVTKATAPTPATSSSSDPTDVPALTLSEPSSSINPPQVSLSRDLDHLPLTTSTSADDPQLAGESDAFLSTISSPSLWRDVRNVCEARFDKKDEAQRVWEGMFAGARDWISPNDKALIREHVGYSAMGGV